MSFITEETIFSSSLGDFHFQPIGLNVVSSYKGMGYSTSGVRQARKTGWVCAVIISLLQTRKPRHGECLLTLAPATVGNGRIGIKTQEGLIWSPDSITTGHFPHLLYKTASSLITLPINCISLPFPLVFH